MLINQTLEKLHSMRLTGLAEALTQQLEFPTRGFSQGLENSSLRSAVFHTSHSLYDCFTHIFIGGF